MKTYVFTHDGPSYITQAETYEAALANLVSYFQQQGLGSQSEIEEDIEDGIMTVLTPTAI